MNAPGGIEAISSEIVDSSNNPDASPGHKVLKVLLFWRLDDRLNSQLSRKGFLLEGSYCGDRVRDRFVAGLYQIADQGNNRLAVKETSHIAGYNIAFLSEARLYKTGRFQDGETKLYRSICARIVGGSVGDAFQSSEFQIPVPIESVNE